MTAIAEPLENNRIRDLMNWGSISVFYKCCTGVVIRSRKKLRTMKTSEGSTLL